MTISIIQPARPFCKKNFFIGNIFIIARLFTFLNSYAYYITDTKIYYIIGGIFIITSNLFADALFWFFAIVGVFSLIMDACTFISSHFGCSAPDARIVLSVKNQQDSIEGIMRSLIQKNYQSATATDIIVIDLGSTDDTPRILSHFENEYSFVHVTDKDAYIESIRNMA